MVVSDGLWVVIIFCNGKWVSNLSYVWVMLVCVVEEIKFWYSGGLVLLVM